MPKSEKGTRDSWVDPDDAPELTDDFFGRAELKEGDHVVRAGEGTLTRRGRPPSKRPKRLITLRLDGELIDRLRESGPGWQSRVNAILKKAMEA